MVWSRTWSWAWSVIDSKEVETEPIIVVETVETVEETVEEDVDASSCHDEVPLEEDAKRETPSFSGIMRRFEQRQRQRRKSVKSTGCARVLSSAEKGEDAVDSTKPTPRSPWQHQDIYTSTRAATPPTVKKEPIIVETVFENATAKVVFPFAIEMFDEVEKDVMHHVRQGPSPVVFFSDDVEETTTNSTVHVAVTVVDPVGDDDDVDGFELSADDVVEEKTTITRRRRRRSSSCPRRSKRIALKALGSGSLGSDFTLSGRRYSRRLVATF